MLIPNSHQTGSALKLFSCISRYQIISLLILEDHR